LENRRYQGSTRLADRREAQRFVEGLRGKIRNGDVDTNGKPKKAGEVPTLKEFAQRFIDYVQTRSAEKPKTVAF